MKQVDTTDARAHSRSHALLSEAGARRALEIATGFRTHLIGMYYCDFGLEWSSGGKRQCDFLHHIEIPFAGQRQVLHGDRCLDLKPGKAYFLPGNTPVERRCQERGRVLYLTFRCEWLPGVDPLLDWPDRTPTAIGPCSMKEWESWRKSDWYTDANRLLQLHAQLENWLAAVLPSLNALIDRHLKTHARFEPVFKLVEEKLGADLRITELAKAHGTTLHAFSMAFSSNTNTTPKEYLNRRLNQEAIQLVIGTDLKIKEIAERLRFTDEFYFSRFFLKLNGAAPSQYRTRFRYSEPLETN